MGEGSSEQSSRYGRATQHANCDYNGDRIGEQGLRRSSEVPTRLLGHTPVDTARQVECLFDETGTETGGGSPCSLLLYWGSVGDSIASSSGRGTWAKE
jgi:hypothetical protein